MAQALYAPHLGYYRTTRPKFGQEGDFVTAPELSPLFSVCLAQQCKGIARDLSSFQILELGAGAGTLACDILKTLAEEQALPEKYLILELSAALQQQQRAKINTLPPELAQRVEWISSLPPQLTGVILANEVMDAMPVHRFSVNSAGIQEFFVGIEQENFVWRLKNPSNTHLEAEIKKLNLTSLPYESEINLYLPAWIQSLSDCLKQGVILLIDYGFPRHEFYHPDRHMGTLMCHHRHRAHMDPLILTGLQDITAHIDFTQVAESALQADLDVLGFTHQAAFLLNLGLLSLLPSPIDRRTSQEVNILTSPNEMGELFKVMALGKNFEAPLQGFMTHDQRRRL
ncbi:MAG: SAM-dependent methyltransferase [Gammaproteobacteria bacterium]|nr:SAM-dependent methyltransferase [Gammaproteobacteria bacterium]